MKGQVVQKYMLTGDSFIKYQDIEFRDCQRDKKILEPKGKVARKSMVTLLGN